MEHERSWCEQDTPRRIAPSRIIVSFTSYPGRIHAVPQVLTSLYKQSMRPDRILLWLAEEQFPNKEADLPKALVDEATAGQFELRWCDDLGSHKKYFYAMQEFPDDIIVIVDDDLFYHPDTVRVLYDSYLRHPKAVSALAVIGLVFACNGKLAPYSVWIKYYRLYAGCPSMQLMAAGGCGTLYPPNSVDHRGFDKNRILSCCKYNEKISGYDFWLKAHSALNGIPVVLCNSDIAPKEIKNTQNQSIGNEVWIRKFVDNQVNNVSMLYEYNNNYLQQIFNTVIGYNFLIDFPSDKYFVELTKTINLRIDNIQKICKKDNNDIQHIKRIANIISFLIADLVVLQAYGASRKELNSCIVTLQSAAKKYLSKYPSLSEKDGIHPLNSYQPVEKHSFPG